LPELEDSAETKVCLLVAKTTATALYAFDPTADLGEDDHFSPMRQGSVRVVLKFAAPLAATISVIAYAELENVIEVDRDRNLIFDVRVQLATD